MKSWTQASLLLCLVLCSLAPARGGEIQLIAGNQHLSSHLRIRPADAKKWTLEMGYMLPSLPNHEVLFEAGGDKGGVCVVLSDTELFFYHDLSSKAGSTPKVDTYTILPVSTLQSPITIRLEVDLQSSEGGKDSFTFTALGASGNLHTATIEPKEPISVACNSDHIGFGGVAGELAGARETRDTGFPNIHQFRKDEFRVNQSPVSPNVVLADRLLGTLYTGATAAPENIKDPSLWQFKALEHQE